MSNTKIRNGIIAAVIFLIAYYTSDLLRVAGLRPFFASPAFNIVVNFLQVVLCIAGILIAYRTGLKGVLSELGLRAPFGRAAVFSLFATLPMVFAFAFTSSLAAELSFLNLLAFTIISPFAEEVLFRGYIFRQLYRRIKTGFWLAVLLPSMFFALGHLYQSRGVWDFIGITAITFTASLLFSWIFVRWQDNLWVPFGLHCLMNFWWTIFAVDETALGSWLANAARFLTVTIAVLLTIYKDKIWQPLPVEGRTVTEINSD